MFGKHGVLKDGAEAKAVVTSVELYQEGMRGNWGSGFTYDVGLRVHFGDDTTADIVRRIGGMGGTDLNFTVGDIVPVRYDPAHQDKVELDEDALRAAQQQARATSQNAANELAVAAAEAKLTGTAPPAPSAALDPETAQLDALEKLEDQHRNGALSDEEFQAATDRLATEGP
jgi:hypothetical protein